MENPAALTARSAAGDRPRVWKSGAETGSVDTSENYLLSSREDRPDETHATETGREEIDSETVANVRKLESLLRRRGLAGRRLRTVVEQGAAHSEDAWAGRLPGALEFLVEPDEPLTMSPEFRRGNWIGPKTAALLPAASSTSISTPCGPAARLL